MNQRPPARPNYQIVRVPVKFGRQRRHPHAQQTENPACRCSTKVTNCLKIRSPQPSARSSKPPTIPLTSFVAAKWWRFLLVQLYSKNPARQLRNHEKLKTILPSVSLRTVCRSCNRSCCRVPTDQRSRCCYPTRTAVDSHSDRHVSLIDCSSSNPVPTAFDFGLGSIGLLAVFLDTTRLQTPLCARCFHRRHEP